VTTAVRLPGLAALLFGMGAGAAAFSLNLLVSYWLVSSSCQTGSPILLVASQGLTAGLLAITIGGILVAWRSWQQVGVEEQTAQSRGAFMAVFGLAVNVIFAIVIAAQGVATFVLPPCSPFGAHV